MPRRTDRNGGSRAASSAATDVLSQLKDDHKRVKKAYKEFEKLDKEEDQERCEEIVQQVLHELSVHAALEEELLYPAARGEVDDDLLDEAQIEHESMHAAMDQLNGMSSEDEKYAARFTVLCEYVLHHVKEEEGEMFPQLERAKLDWEGIRDAMAERRGQMAGASGEDERDPELADEDAPPVRTRSEGGTDSTARARGQGARMRS